MSRSRERRLYILQMMIGTDDQNPIRIGMSTDVQRRISEHRRYSPFELRLLVDVPCTSLEEKLVHTLLDSELSEHGAEWYRPSRFVRWFVHRVMQYWPYMQRESSDLSMVSEIVLHARYKQDMEPPAL